MKNKIIIGAMVAFFAGVIGICIACLLHFGKGNVITGTEALPTGQCIYTVQTDTVPYTFIDDKGKYAIGEGVK